MKTYKELSFRYLKKQRKRAILTICGIILSVALICGTGIIGESFQQKMIENIRYNYGYFHVGFSNVKLEQLNILNRHVKVEKVGTILPVGLQEIADRVSISVAGYNRVAVNMFYYSLLSGRWPQKDGEIAIEQWALDNMPQKPRIGERIPFNMIGGNFMGIAIEPSIFINKEFKLVGIINNKTSSQFSGVATSVITLASARSILGNPESGFITMVLLRDKLPFQKTIAEIQSATGLKKEQMKQNTALLTTNSQSNTAVLNKSVRVIESLLISLIILATVAVIYNAFHISVLERIRQFGLLRAVGATPAQIKRVVLHEAFLLSLIGIPLGILAGIIAMKILLGLFALNSRLFLGGIKVVIPPAIIVVSTVLGLVAVLFSVFGPVLMASRVSPLRAIQPNFKLNKENLKRRGARLQKTFLGKLFGVEGRMAYENIKRNRARYRITLFSMCTGIILAIVFVSFMNSITVAMNTRLVFQDLGVEQPFNNTAAGFSENDYHTLTGITGVKNVYRLMVKQTDSEFSLNQLNPKYRDFLMENFQKQSSALKSETINIPTFFYGFREKELRLIFKKFLEHGAITPVKMTHEKGVLIYQGLNTQKGEIPVSRLKVGDSILVSSGVSHQPVKIKVTGILRTSPLFQPQAPGICIITTEEVYKEITQTQENSYQLFNIELAPNANREYIKTQLQKVAKQYPKTRVSDFVEQRKNVNEVQWELSILLYGLVSVISLIGALNIVNTISTSLILRIREFGILRAIGMTAAQMRKMIEFEGLFYGFIAVIYGSLIGVVLARVLYLNINNIRNIPWTFPWQAIVITGLATLAVTLLASLAPLKRIAGMNIVESVRMEE